MAKADSTRRTRFHPEAHPVDREEYQKAPTSVPDAVDHAGSLIANIEHELGGLQASLLTARDMCGQIISGWAEESDTETEHAHAASIILDAEYDRCERLIEQCMQATRDAGAPSVAQVSESGRDSTWLSDSGHQVELFAIDLRDWICTLADAGQELRMPIGELVNRDDLVSRMDPLDALQIGSWHGAYIERRSRRGRAEGVSA